MSLKQVAGKLDVSYQTVLNWTRHGVDGRKLEAVRVGKAIRTSPAAVHRFVLTCDEIVTDNAEEDRRELMERHGI